MAIMVTTETRRYGTPDNPPLIDVSTDVLGPEFAAALYESYAADYAVSGPTAGRQSRAAYAGTAHRLCEEIEADRWEEIETEREFDLR